MNESGQSMSLFWDWFDNQAAPRLALREISFRKTFAYLDTLPGPLTIVETGCARAKGNWAGDGQSSVLFDTYLGMREKGSQGWAIDLDPQATALCKEMVSDRIQVRTGDSVPTLRELAVEFRQTGRTIDFLYLDSYDVDWNNPTPSAVHHLKELVSIVPVLRPDTLVMVDDAPSTCRVVGNRNGQYDFVSLPVVGGKGTYVAEYARQVEAPMLFSHYQAAWTGFVK